MNRHPDNATTELIRRLGPEKVVTDPDGLYVASMDNLRYSRLPAARLLPADEEDVGVILQLANAHHKPVTARGAGSSTTGAATPDENGWVLDLAHWRELQIDPIGRMAYVQPGVTLEQLDNAAAACGLMYPPDPGSKAHATIGGTIATNAGGMRGAKYGVTRDYVISLEGFLPSGEFVRWGGNLKKFSAGYNVRDLWIGAEGTLGIVTGAVMRLIPRPASQATCLGVFRTDADALGCAHAILQRGFTPSALEFLDGQTAACTFAFWRKRSPALLGALPPCLAKWADAPEAPAVLLIEVDGQAAEVEKQLEDIAQTVRSFTEDSARAIEPEAVEGLWKIRRSCSQAMFEWGSRKLNEDVVVPFDAQMELIRFVRQLKEETGLPTPTFGHAADGNFHVHIMYNAEDAAATEAAKEGIHSLMNKVVALGGAISGEHGIGLAKSPFFALQHSPAEIQVMRAIKEALDPNNILNPGKLWTVSEPWTFPREDVKMPWDH